MYGLDNDKTAYFGRQCLLARRLVERGVRFIQIYSGGNHNETRTGTPTAIWSTTTICTRARPICQSTASSPTSRSGACSTRP
ncbi:MAG: DUF1501 domain-containing protein [Planctomycetaceae bacterium]